MKSRKSDSKKRTRKHGSQRKALLNAVRTIEHLEKREMLNADWETDLASRAFFSNAESRDETLAYIRERRESGGGSSNGEGGPGDIVAAAEVEPNGGISVAQLVPLAGNLGVNISGSASDAFDEDWYAVDLEAGAIIDANLSLGINNIVNLPQMSFYDSNGLELIASETVPGLPAASPLTGGGTGPILLGDIALHYVVPTSGRYFLRTSNVLGGYNLQLRQYRPTFEAEPFDTHQVLFLDFDGAAVNRSLFLPGLPGSARFSPTRNFLGQYGIQDQDYDRFIDEVVARVQSKFDQLGEDTTNPNFSLEIRNSKDHVDPWGQQNVSRVVIGGTWQELIGDPAAPSSGILGIAQSVDSGNFDREETAIVMHDVLIATTNIVPLDPFSPRVDAIAELMALVIAHEAGHYFGGHHQEPFNNTLSIMDSFYDPIVSSGAGPDGIFGNADDAPILFQADAFPLQQWLPGAVNDVVNWMGWALTSGRGNAATITGNVFNDINENRILDPVDLGVQAVVYADANNNGLFDEAIDYFTVSAADGTYSLEVPEGTHTVRVGTPLGFRLTTAEALPVTVAAGGVAAGVNFGHVVANPAITGTKFNDINGNGQRDAGEGGLEGVFIYIDLDGDDRIDIGEPATQTAADGTYRLVFPGPGLYAVREIVDSGFVQTFPGPALGFEHIVSVTGDPAIDAASLSGLDFGNVLTVDFGDAAESYGVARHGFVPGFRLGTEWDAEQVSLFSASATGDDVDGAVGAGGGIVDDEDGVVLSRPLVAGSSNNRVSIVTQNTAGLAGFLNAWADFNGNGVFDSTERIVSDQLIAGGADVATDVIFSAPSTAGLGETPVRFRFSAEAGIGATGETATGEVEDYVFTVVDSLELAVDDAFSVSRNSQLNFLDVLSNDFKLPGEALEIVSVSGSSAGATIQVADGGIRYTPPNGFIGQDVFTYRMRNSAGEEDTATVVVNVNLFFDNPLAVDDSFNVPTNSIDFPLNVLANDIEGQNGALSIISVTQPNRNGIIEIATGGKSLRYRPQVGFGGTEQFTYTVADSAGNQSTAQVTLHTLPGDTADDIAQIELVTTDLEGNPITAIQQGQNFQVQVFVDDLRFSTPGNPGVAAGVFAAYADILYDLQLVSTVPNTATSASGFTFDASFFNDYDNFQRGDATVPGIVDEFGAFSNRPVMDEPDPVLLGTITFAARSPGIADFMPDPADVSPDSDTLLFDTPGSAVPVERIRYIGTNIEIVGDGVEFPIAVDDSLPNAIPAGVIQFPIDVLANDIPGSTGVIQLVSSTDGLFGSTLVDTRGTASLTDDRILYTPNGGFNGADQFTYTIQDTRGIQSTARVTVRVGAADANDIVALDLQVTDLNGTPIDQVTQGSQFQLRGFVDDLREGFGIDAGVFAAYEDVLYSAGLVSPVASTTNDPDLGFQVEFGPNYQRVRDGDIRTPGIINEIGAVQIENGNMPLGSDRFLLFTVTLTADSPGVASFIADPADISPFHDTLTFDPVDPVPFDQIRYGFDEVTIVSASGGEGEFHNYRNPEDVNGDGFVSPIDGLMIVNGLNGGGQPGSGSGEGESGSEFYWDVDNNGFLTALDALRVFNVLNGLFGNGEGEAFDLSSLNTAPTEIPTEYIEVPDAVVEAGKAKIGARDAGYDYGPAFFDIDSIYDDSGEEIDDLVTELAPEIDETWKSRLS